MGYITPLISPANNSGKRIYCATKELYYPGGSMGFGEREGVINPFTCIVHPYGLVASFMLLS